MTLGHHRYVGIRYYAYAFSSDMTERALADPRSFLSGDPFADAWGMEPGAMIGTPTFEQRTPESDMLYLDKAWWYLQKAIGPSEWGAAARPAYRMFEGRVFETYGYGYEPWVRAITPSEVADIARDMESISEEDVAASLRSNGSASPNGSDDVSYALSYFRRAREYVRGIAASGRGFVYMIG